MIRSTGRCFTAGIAGSLAGLVLSAVICWVWLATVDGSEHFGW